MLIPLIRTKLHRPPVSRDHVHRVPLLDRLGLHHHQPLTLVSAPAGYGKSTLVSCWLENIDVPNAWISLDENDNDLRLFLSYFVTAIQNISSSCGDILYLLKVAHLPPASVLARNLINELDQIGKKFILVLDDYHHITDKSIHELMATLLAHPSAFMQLVLISRRDPPLPLTSLRAKGKMVDVRTRDLCFSLDETAVYLKKVTGRPLTPVSVARWNGSR